VADTPRWLTLDRHSGPAGVRQAFLAVLDGTLGPDRGAIVRP
jgi:hypothetical protein